jgi:DDE family transposase
MMGRLKSEQGELFYEFCLGDAVPEDHLVRKIFERSRHERKKIEMRFAHLKRILKLGRLRLRGPRGAQDEFVLAAIAQNLRRLAVLVARPPPVQALVPPTLVARADEVIE